jgi:hypothetical protein
LDPEEEPLLDDEGGALLEEEPPVLVELEELGGADVVGDEVVGGA